MRFNEYTSLSTYERKTWLKKRFKRDLDILINDVRSGAAYIGLKHSFIDRTDEEIEDYILSGIINFLGDLFENWELLRKYGFIVCFLAAYVDGCVGEMVPKFS